MMMLPETTRNGRTVPEVLHDIADNVKDIARLEFQLAKTELKREVAELAKASRTLGAGVTLGLYALGFALLAAVYALATVIAVYWAALAVAAGVGLVSLVLIGSGRSKLANIKHAQPEKWIDPLMSKENGQWTKDQSNLRGTSRTAVTASARTSAS
jgi:uncharacterized membrane protein YqjE